MKTGNYLQRFVLPTFVYVTKWVGQHVCVGIKSRG